MLIVGPTHLAFGLFKDWGGIREKDMGGYPLRIRLGVWRAS